MFLSSQDYFILFQQHLGPWDIDLKQTQSESEWKEKAEKKIKAMKWLRKEKVVCEKSGIIKAKTTTKVEWGRWRWMRKKEISWNSEEMRWNPFVGKCCVLSVNISISLQCSSTTNSREKMKKTKRESFFPLKYQMSKTSPFHFVFE